MINSKLYGKNSEETANCTMVQHNGIFPCQINDPRSFILNFELILHFCHPSSIHRAQLLLNSIVLEEGTFGTIDHM